jgi:hypothetical protein
VARSRESGDRGNLPRLAGPRAPRASGNGAERPARTRETVTGRDGKQYPAAIERQPRGKQKASARIATRRWRRSRRRLRQGKGDGGALGGSGIELERRRGK